MLGYVMWEGTMGGQSRREVLGLGGSCGGRAREGTGGGTDIAPRAAGRTDGGAGGGG